MCSLPQRHSESQRLSKQVGQPPMRKLSAFPEGQARPTLERHTSSLQQTYVWFLQKQGGVASHHLGFTCTDNQQ